LQKPLLYLSLYLKTHRERYYELLQKVRHAGFSDCGCLRRPEHDHSDNR
jgi:hypothetical protein